LRRTGTALLAASLAIIIGIQVGYSQATTTTHTMAAGETHNVSCATRLTGTVGANAAALVCATLAPTQTPVAATATPTGHTANWHPPADHEHGDAPPSWVTGAGYTPSFDHAANTPNENAHPHKHSAFKGFLLNDDGAAIYAIGHMDFNPGGHPSRFHSFQFWMRDPSGGITHLHGWLDFGTGNNTGPQVRRIHCDNTDVRPIMAVNAVACGDPLQFESWYAAAGGYQNQGAAFPDFGWNINPNYYAGGDPANPATWDDTGYVRNLTRRFEVAYYHTRDARRGEFYTTQFGQSVTGPSDPKCGTSLTVGERTYTLLCLKQTVATTARTVGFPGNAVQRDYPGSGTVKLPN
jgi:hypothetical protein